MEDHRLRVFCLIVELGSFSKAARAKFMTQSGISHLVRGLEEELRVKLLHRAGKQVVPTAAGKMLYERAQGILGGYASLLQDLADLTGTLRTPLAIAASHTAAAFVLPQVLYDFVRTHPGARVDLQVADGAAIAERLVQGDIEAGISESPGENGGLDIEPLVEDEIVIIAAENNPLAARKSVSVADVLAQPLILPEQGSGIRAAIQEGLGMTAENARNMQVVMTLGSPELIVRMVQSGMGLAFLSKWAVFEQIKEGSVAPLTVAGKRLARPFCLLTLRQQPSSLAGRLFVDFLRQYRFFAPF